MYCSIMRRMGIYKHSLELLRAAPFAAIEFRLEVILIVLAAPGVAMQ
jgi:hypothetical protein